MFIELEQVSKSYGQSVPGSGVPAVKTISLGVDQGRMLALVGSSGSGKTTLLRCIAGLVTPETGAIRVGGQELFSAARGINVPTERRDLGLMFQSYALWPHMTVEQNVAFPLRKRRVPAEESRARVRKYLEMVGCENLVARYPHELSGGQQQRVALARGLVYEPRLMLFDEPLSNLDPTLRDHLRSQIRELQRSIGFTGVYVTHDRGEAFYLGDSVALLSFGELVQFGSPDQIYRRPANPTVAEFVGIANRALGTLSGNGLSFEAEGIGSLAVPSGLAQDAGAGEVTLMIRPEAIRLQSQVEAGPKAKVVDLIDSGDISEYVFEFDQGRRWRSRILKTSERLDLGQPVSVIIDDAGIFLFSDLQTAIGTRAS